MIIDLAEIKKLQKTYQNDHIVLNALNNMVNVVSQSNAEELMSSVALSTLKSLGVVKEETSTGEVQQLNS